MSLVLKLLPGIKRRLTRQQDARSEVADAGLRAKRPGVLARHRMTCAGCRYVTKNAQHLDVHHFDDDHQNNDDDNLVAACHACHPYQHIGEVSVRTDQWAESIGRQTILAHIPELGAADVSLLQRAIGAAMLDDSTEDEATEILNVLLERSEATKEMFGTWFARDFAGAMSVLTTQQYADREEAIKAERLMFSEGLLRKLGKEFMTDYPSRPVSTWSQVTQGLAARKA